MTEPIGGRRSAPGLPADAATLTSRLDRLEVWSLGPWVLGIIGVGFLFIFYDILDINVSFVQTCVQIKPGCTAVTALGALRLPVLLNLVGYAFGALVLGPVSDLIGRRHMMVITMLVAGLGSLYTAFSPDYGNFIASRIVTGVGVGADLAVVNTYLNEVAPRRGRGRFHSAIFIMSALGSLIGVWVALVLTTSSAPWPEGLPGALAGPGFGQGWRWTYGIGALLALAGLAMRFRLPESPRWLAWKGHLEDAGRIVAGMEVRAARAGELAPPVPAGEESVVPLSGAAAYRAIFSSARYVRRLILVFFTWGLLYTCIYSFVAGYTSILTVQGYSPPEAGIITAIGSIGIVGCAVFATMFADRFERKTWLIAGAVITIGGSVLVAEGGGILGAFAGSAIVFFGFNLWTPVGYAWSAENFPTRARTTGFALVDGVGHAGGGVGVLLIVPLIPHLGALYGLLLVAAFISAAAVIAQFGVRTRGRRLEEISP